MATRRRSVPAIALWAAAWLALSACGSKDAPAPAPVDTPPPAVASVDGHLDPTPYRAEIQAAEALLYATDAPSNDDWKNLSRALLELHNAIVFHDSSAAARETSRRLFFFSAEVDAESSPKHLEEERASVRDRWEKIRTEQFAQADWFRTATR
ncbi:MAG TPA: hypothetical protein VMR50_17085 [Myxococcota bacterium]|nr:hypothetical protein [Myxococcota bacterium]